MMEISEQNGFLTKSSSSKVRLFIGNLMEQTKLKVVEEKVFKFW